MDEYINPSGLDLYDVTFFNADKGFAVGEEGAILRTSDSGITWESLGATQSIYGANFVNENEGILVGLGGIILKTTDGGESWTRQVISDGSSPSSWLYDVSFRTEEYGLAVGENGVVLETNSGGQSGIIEKATQTIFYIVFVMVMVMMFGHQVIMGQ